MVVHNSEYGVLTADSGLDIATTGSGISLDTNDNPACRIVNSVITQPLKVLLTNCRWWHGSMSLAVHHIRIKVFFINVLQRIPPPASLAPLILASGLKVRCVV